MHEAISASNVHYSQWNNSILIIMVHEKDSMSASNVHYNWMATTTIIVQRGASAGVVKRVRNYI